MTCSICGSIQDFASANTGRDEHFGPPITSLKWNGIEPSYDDLRECPECDAVFHWHDYTAQTGSGNNDEEVLTRLPSELTPFVRAFLHRGERPAADVAQDAGRLLELPDVPRQLLLSHVLRHDRELAARLVPWMLDEINQRDPDWAGGFVRRFASGDDAARLMSELSLRPPSPALEKLRAHCKQVLCSVCPTVVAYRRTIARRDRPPPPLDALVQLGASDELDVWECPECDSMFIWETKHGDEGSLIRQSESLASSLRACVHRTGVVPDADKERVFAADVPKVVLAHGMRRDRELVRQLVPRMISALARFEHPWLHDILCDFVDGEQSDAKVVLDAIEKTSRTNPLVEAVAVRCRQRRWSMKEIDPVADWDAFEGALAKMTNEDAWSELERVIETLTAKEAWKDLESVLRRAIRLIAGFAGTRIGAREKVDVEHDLWKRLGLLYSHRLDAKDSALIALEMAVKHRADDDEIHLALAALHEQAGHVEPAIRSNEAAVRIHPTRIDGYRNLFRIHSQQGAHHAAWCAASAIAFLKHPGPEAEFYARHALPAAPAVGGNLEETSWLLLRHEDESDVITNVFRVIAPSAARLAIAEKRSGSAVDRWFWSASDIGPAELAFMAGRNAAYLREPFRSLFNDHRTISELEDLFMAALRAVWLDGWGSWPAFGERAVERASELVRFFEPNDLPPLRIAVMAVGKRRLIDIRKWANGVELTAARAGLLFSGDLVTAETALRHLADRACGVGLTVEQKMHDLLAFAASETYVGLRKKSGREPRILPALLDPAGPPLTVGALEAALGMQLGPSILPRSGLGLLSTTNVSVKYGWHFTGGAVTTLEDLRARSLVEWSATFAQGSAATDAALRERFGPPRELPSGRGRAFGPWILVPAAGGQACTLSWYAKLPDWAVPPTDAARRQRALFELATALTTAETIADLARALSSLPDSCGLVHDPRSMAERSAYLEFVPPIGASELARIFGWRDAVGQTFDMHMQTWVVRVVTGQAAYGPETALPTIASWSVTATLDGPPSGDEWIQPIPTESGQPFVFKRPGGTRRFAPPDVVRFIKFG